MDIFTRPQRPQHIKRPLNSFMVWAKEKRRIMNRNNPKMRNADISKILGEEWRKMSEEDKQPYMQQALYLRRQHKIDYPNYRYRPRRNKKQLDPAEIDDQGTRPSFARMYSNVYLPSSSSSHGSHHLPYSYDSYFPSLFTMDRIAQHGIPFQPKLIAPPPPPYSPSYLFMSRDMKETKSSPPVAATDGVSASGSDELKASAFQTSSAYNYPLSCMMVSSKKQL